LWITLISQPLPWIQLLRYGCQRSHLHFQPLYSGQICTTFWEVCLDISKSVTLSFPDLPSDDTTDSPSPHERGLISVLYNPPNLPQLLQEVRQHWEDDLGAVMREDQWLSWGRTSSPCARHNVIHLKILLKVHWTRAKLAEIFSRPCSESQPADLTLILWSCPYVSTFWGDTLWCLVWGSLQTRWVPSLAMQKQLLKAGPMLLGPHLSACLMADTTPLGGGDKHHPHSWGTNTTHIHGGQTPPTFRGRITDTVSLLKLENHFSSFRTELLEDLGPFPEINSTTRNGLDGNTPPSFNLWLFLSFVKFVHSSETKQFKVSTYWDQQQKIAPCLHFVQSHWCRNC